MIYIRDGIPYRQRLDLCDASTESCVIEISRPKAKKILVWTVYRAPGNDLDTFIEDLLKPVIAEIRHGSVDIAWRFQCELERKLTYR